MEALEARQCHLPLHYGSVWAFVFHCALQPRGVHLCSTSSLLHEKMFVPWSWTRCRDWRDRWRHHATCPGRRKTFSRLCTCPETDPILIWCRILKPYLVPLKRVCPPPQSRRAVPGEWKLHFILPITCQTDFKIYHVAVFQGTFRCPSLPCRSRSKLWIIL